MGRLVEIKPFTLGSLTFAGGSVELPRNKITSVGVDRITSSLVTAADFSSLSSSVLWLATCSVDSENITNCVEHDPLGQNLESIPTISNPSTLPATPGPAPGGPKFGVIIDETTGKIKMWDPVQGKYVDVALEDYVEALIRGLVATLPTEASIQAAIAEASSRVATLDAIVQLNAANTLEALSAEAQARAADLLAEVENRSNAILIASQEQAAALLDATETIQAAFESEQFARESADDAEASARETLVAQINDPVSGLAKAHSRITSESAARVSAIEAEAFARGVLAVEIADAHAAIISEKNARTNAVETLAASISQLSVGSPVQFDAAKIWMFDAGAESWTSNGTILTPPGGWIRPANHATDSMLISPAGLTFDGSKYSNLMLRAKMVGSPTWKGKLYWATSTQSGFSESRMMMLALPSPDSKGIVVINAVDIPWAGTITQIRLDLSGPSSDDHHWEVDWIAIGRPTPGASIAALEEEREARISAIGAETAARDTLAAQMRGSYEGNDLTQVTTGLIYEERTARVSATDALATRTSSLETTVNHGTKGVAAAHARITTEEQARANGDSANSTAISNIRASLTGGANLIPNSGYEVDASGVGLGWKQVAGDPEALWGRDYAGDDWRPAGMHNVGVHRPGTPTGIQDLSLTGVPTPVEANARYCLSAWMAAHRCNTLLLLAFYTAADVYISEVGSPTVTVATGGGRYIANWLRTHVFVSAPSNAAFARVFMRQIPTGEVDPYSWTVRPKLERATAQQTLPSPWDESTAGVASKIKAAADANSATAASVQQVAARLNTDGDVRNAIVQAQSTATTAKDRTEATWGITLQAGTKRAGLKAHATGEASSLLLAADQVMIAADNLIADEGFYSPQWWSGGAFDAWPASVYIASFGVNEGKPLRAARINAGATQDWLGQRINVTPGEPYRVRLRIFRSSNFAGKIFAGVHFPNIAWAMPGAQAASVPGQFGDLPWHNDPASLNAWRTYEGIWTTLEGFAWLQTRILAEITAGYCEIALELHKAVGAKLLVDGSVTAQKINVSALSAISAYLGTLIAGVIEFAGGTGWSGIIRTASKWWGDLVPGWISAARPETGDFFQEFRAANGNALIVERKAGGPNMGGAHYYLYVKDPAGVERLLIDPQAGVYKLRGHVEATSGSFEGDVIAETFRAQSAETGQRVVMTEAGVEVFDSNNVRRVRLGVW